MAGGARCKAAAIFSASATSEMSARLIFCAWPQISRRSGVPLKPGSVTCSVTSRRPSQLASAPSPEPCRTPPRHIAGISRDAVPAGCRSIGRTRLQRQAQRRPVAPRVAGGEETIAHRVPCGRRRPVVAFSRTATWCNRSLIPNASPARPDRGRPALRRGPDAPLPHREIAAPGCGSLRPRGVSGPPGCDTARVNTVSFDAGKIEPPWDDP